MYTYLPPTSKILQILEVYYLKWKPSITRKVSEPSKIRVNEREI